MRALFLALSVLWLFGCDPSENDAGPDAAVTPGDGDGDGDGDDRFSDVPALPACDAPEPEYLIDEEIDGRSVALYGDTLILGARDAIYTLPKDGSAAPVAIEGAGAGLSVAVAGDFLFAVGNPLLAAFSLPAGDESDMFDLSGVAGRRVVGDSSGAYFGSDNFDCTPEIDIFALDGERRTLGATCVKGIATYEGTVYVVDEGEATNAVLRAGPDGDALEVVVEDPAIDEPIAVNDTHVYFTLRDDDVSMWYLARYALDGAGEIELLAGPNHFDSLRSDGTDVFFKTSFVPDICTYQLEQGSDAITAISSTGEVEAWDETHLYLKLGFVGGAAARIAR